MRELGLGLFALMAACTGKGAGQPAVRYQAGDARPLPQPLRFTFDQDPTDALPAEVQVFSGRWVVRAEPDAPSAPNALCQIGTAEFPAVRLGDAVLADVVVIARFKPISGKTDQAAGLIARVQDQNNYYILRANALEGNVNLYKYANGRRSRIKDAKAAVEQGRWQELRFEVSGNRLRGFLNDRLVVEATDNAFAAGGFGLWTKADSVTCFDDVEVRAL